MKAKIVAVLIGVAALGTAACVPVPVTQRAPDQRESSVQKEKKAEQKGKLTSFGQGDYFVSDIKPGTYTAQVDTEEWIEMCSWEFRNKNNELKDIDIVDSGKAIVKIDKTQGYVFSSSGCTQWVLED